MSAQSGRTELTPRQLRELEYHKQYAVDYRAMLTRDVDMRVALSGERRWHNAYWETYRIIRTSGLAGKRVLVPGCGGGADVIRLAAIGADAYGCDLSPDIIALARDRAARAGLKADFRVLPAERLDYPDGFFDAALLIDVLHHVDIPVAMREISRVLRRGALVIGDELYTHSALQRIRESVAVRRWLYPRMVRFIYGTDKPYITEDERKIDQREFAVIAEHVRGVRCRYFGMVQGRLIPDWAWACKLDRALMIALGPLGRLLAGRVVFVGEAR